MANDPADSSGKFSLNAWFREWLAAIVVVVSLVAVIILAGIAIHVEKGQAKDILTMVLPMIGTWVGTVLAFYFGKEQLEAATRSVTAIARELTPEEKLRSIKVTDKMIPRAAAHVAKDDPDKLKLVDAVAGLEKEKKGNRLPVMTSDDKPRYVIHRSAIDRFIAKTAASGSKSAADLQALTLKDLLGDPELESQLKNTFATVRETATLADAKRAMESIPWCQDVLVTRTGASDEPVIGWITNAIIEANSKV